MPFHAYSLQAIFLLYSRFLVDKDSFSKLDSRLQQILYIFACTNSVADPFVYGFFNLRLANIVHTQTREFTISQRLEVNVL